MIIKIKTNQKGLAKDNSGQKLPANIPPANAEKTYNIAGFNGKKNVFT